MNHKGTVSRREKSLVLNQAPILHEKSNLWVGFTFNLPTNHRPRDVLRYSHHCYLEPQQGPRAGANSTQIPGAAAAQGCPASTPTLLGLPQAQVV